MLPDVNETNVGHTHEIAGHGNIERCYSTWQKQHHIVLVCEAIQMVFNAFVSSRQIYGSELLLNNQIKDHSKTSLVQ